MRSSTVTAVAALFVLCAACSKSDTQSEQRQLIRVTASEKLPNGLVQLEEPRYVVNGKYLKFWDYGEPFGKMRGGTFAIHASGICSLALGKGWFFSASVPSESVATGESGVILSDIDGKFLEAIEFKPADKNPIRFADGSVFQPKESNFWISKLLCQQR